MQILHFKTNVQLKNVIGRDLINDDNVAIQELVKNSFDAGSKKVKIIFRNFKKNKDKLISNDNKEKFLRDSSKILIIDSGEGMSLEDLKDKWLNIAYSSKKSEKEKFGRVMAGAKGVGRFSCDRLGEYLNIYTKSEKDEKINYLSINWNDFEIENDLNYEIQKVEVILNEPLSINEFEKQNRYLFGKSGTILEISKLREEWITRESGKYNYNKLISLKTHLEKLTNPNQKIDKNSFVVDLIIEELDKNDFNLNTQSGNRDYNFLKGPVENKIFKKLSFKTTFIESVISKDGKTITTVLKDRDRTIFKLIEKNKFRNLKDIKIIFYFLNQYSKAYFKRETGIESLRFGSVFLFINGFRVPPFGDYGDGWLGLELRKGQGRARYLGARDLIGRVEINDSNNIFKIISNREGLVRNKAHDELVGNSKNNFKKSYFYSMFRKLELFVVNGLDWDSITKSPDKDNIEEEERFEVKEFMKGFYNKLKSKKWKYNPKDEIYAISQEEKDYRTIQQIHKIITVTTKEKDIISLYINEKIIQNLAKENVEKLNSILQSVKNFDLKKFDLKTSKGIEKIKKTLEELAKKAETEEKERKTAEKKASEESKKRKEAEEERDKAKKEAEEERQKREGSEKRELFIKSLLGKDTEEIQKLQHQIKISSNNISEAMLYLKENYVDKNKSPPVSFLKSIISDIILESYKINKITSIVTSANFDLYSKKIKEDIVTFIKEYTEGFKSRFIKTNIKCGDIEFKTYFSPLEVQIIVDNLYNNSDKAGANDVTIQFEKRSPKELKLKFIDNGRKVSKEHIPELFKFGFTTRKGGSGIGLYNIKSILKSMNSEIKFIQDDNE